MKVRNALLSLGYRSKSAASAICRHYTGEEGGFPACEWTQVLVDSSGLSGEKGNQRTLVMQVRSVDSRLLRATDLTARHGSDNQEGLETFNDGAR